MKYYVYRHIRLDSNTPFYVGKGCGTRVFDNNSRRRNSYHQNIAKKHGVRFEIVKRFSSAKDALKFEVKLIKLYKSLGLCEANLSNGGEYSEFYEPWNKGRTDIYSIETRKKMGADKIGKIPSKETRMKMSKKRQKSDNPAWKGFIKTPNGTFETLREAAQELNISIMSVSRRCNSKKFNDWYFDRTAA